MSLEKKKYLELQEKEDIYLNSRRSSKGFSQVIYRSRTKEKPEIFESQIRYNFLQYHRVIFEWAKRKTGLSSDHIELLLYLQPIGVFNKFQGESMLKAINMRWGSVYKFLINKGYLRIWREKKGDRPALYTLTQKASNVCSQMHKMFIGEIKVPSGERSIMAKPKKASNTYYLDLIKEMDKKKAERDSNS